MIDYSNDYLQWDNTEEVIVATVRNSVATEHRVTHALAGDVDRRRAQFSGVSIQGDELLWMIPIALLPETTEINQGDRIKQCCGANWTVLTAKQRGIGSHNTHWEAICRRLST